MRPNLHFGSSSSTCTSNGYNRRATIYALRVFLQHPDLLDVVMESCEDLLILMGKTAVWPEHVLKKITRCLRDDAAEQSDSSECAIKNDDDVKQVKGCEAWSRYEYTIRQVYDEKPKLVELAQRFAMFAECVYGNSRTELSSAIESALQKLATVTPGDFANVQRQENLMGERYSADEFLKCLGRECAFKPGGRTNSIGFIG